ncbi:hypothetical protein SESBI_21727 [Sesbania bispinosa]|nr:hypothetical protein SESBI_21727 [Sesbania bispinosa]
MEPRRITLILHHRGSLVREMGKLSYVGGEFCVWEGLDVETVNLFTVETLCKEHYYRRFEKIFWLKPGRDLDLGLRELVKDAHVFQMCNAGMENNGEVEIYFLHPVDLPFIIVDENPESGQHMPQPVPTPVPTPVPSPVSSPVPTPMPSPVPTHVPSPVPSPEPSPVPTREPSPLPSNETSYTDDYESAEDEVYRPSPHVSDADEVVQEIPVRRKGGPTSAEKGKGVVVSGSRKKGKNNCGSGGNSNRGEFPFIFEEFEVHVEDEQPEEDEVFIGGSIGHRQTYTYGMPTENQDGPQHHEMTSDEDSHSYHSEQLNTLVCGHNNHNIRKCTNIGVPQKPKNWVAPAPAEPQARPDEVNLSQGVPNADPPTSQPDNSQTENVDNHTTELAATNSQPLVTVSASTFVQPQLISPTSNIMRGQACSRPSTRGTNFKNPPYRPPGSVSGGLRKKMNTVRPQTVTHTPPPRPLP